MQVKEEQAYLLSFPALQTDQTNIMSSSLSSLSSSTFFSNPAVTSALSSTTVSQVSLGTATSAASSAAVTTGPAGATASSCSPSSILRVAPSNFPHPYCAYNAEILIPNLSSCCGDGEDDLTKGRDSTVYVHKNCTQYCAVSPSKTSSWRACVINLYPEANVYGYNFPCFFEYPGNSRDYRIETNKYTSDNNPNDGDELASPTDVPDAAAGVEKPSLTFTGWIVSLLVAGAGFIG
ncbi:hypothetical protein P3342_001157 [Pyrenophora teres f. teres]|nr:hypothetical protein P3342_001157 [Pyrenophora teres f. teres]